MIITAIEQAKKRESRANIFLDGRFWLGIDKNDLLEFGLFKGKEIDEAEKKKIEESAGFNKMLEKAISFTFVRPRSEREMTDYLRQKRGLEKSEAEKIIEKLKERSYLDDQKFAEWYVKNRIDFGVHGENKILAELMKKGISSRLAREVLKSFESEESSEKLILKIQKYAKKVTGSIKATSEREREQKLIKKLLERGFSYSDIKKALNSDSD